MTTSNDRNQGYDVIVVGGGNAALCAALTAREEGATVLLLECAPEEERGGNSSFTEGLMRCVYNGSEDIRALSPDLTPDELASDFGRYTEDKFFDDMARVTQNRTDPDLCEILVKQSNATMHWMRSKGIRFLPQFGRQAFKVDGKFTFWGGATLAAVGGGRGLVDQLYRAAEKAGVQIRYNAWVRDLIHSDAGVTGVVVKMDQDTREFAAKSVVLACGGFEANAAWRARHLGPGWDLASWHEANPLAAIAIPRRWQRADRCAAHRSLVRLSRGGLGAFCRRVRQLRNHGRLRAGQLSVLDHGINSTRRKRFLDEGADIRNYTYAKYGRIILQQPDQFAWQIFDLSVTHLLRPEYRARRVNESVTANSIEELADRLEDVNRDALIETIKAYNASITRCAVQP